MLTVVSKCARLSLSVGLALPPRTLSAATFRRRRRRRGASTGAKRSSLKAKKRSSKSSKRKRARREKESDAPAARKRRGWVDWWLGGWVGGWSWKYELEREWEWEFLWEWGCWCGHSKKRIQHTFGWSAHMQTLEKSQCFVTRQQAFCAAGRAVESYETATTKQLKMGKAVLVAQTASPWTRSTWMTMGLLVRYIAPTSGFEQSRLLCRTQCWRGARSCSGN